jgi:hypothetical protein
MDREGGKDGGGEEVAYEIDKRSVEVGYTVPKNIAVWCLEEKRSLADTELQQSTIVSDSIEPSTFAPFL